MILTLKPTALSNTKKKTFSKMPNSCFRFSFVGDYWYFDEYKDIRSEYLAYFIFVSDLKAWFYGRQYVPSVSLLEYCDVPYVIDHDEDCKDG